MSGLRSSRRCVSLSLTALLGACALITSACTDDGGGEDEVAGTEEDDTAGDTETDGGECLPPPEDAQEFGAQQYVEVVNTLGAPVWIKGGTCGAAIMQLQVDGEPWRDNTALFERCANLVENDYCSGTCAPDDATVPSISFSNACCTPSPETSRVIEG